MSLVRLLTSQFLIEVSQGNFQLVFFTPEMLIGSKRWRNMLTGNVYSERLKAFVIDEAHCVTAVH